MFSNYRFRLLSHNIGKNKKPIQYHRYTVKSNIEEKPTEFNIQMSVLIKQPGEEKNQTLKPGTKHFWRGNPSKF